MAKATDYLPKLNPQTGRMVGAFVIAAVITTYFVIPQIEKVRARQTGA